YGVLIDRRGRALRAAMAQATYITPDLGMVPGIRKTDHGIVFSPPDDIEDLPRALITMPWGALHNYGHFVCDCLRGVAALHQMVEFRDAVYAFPSLKPWHREHLQLLGVAPIELTRNVYYVESAIFTNCMDYFLNTPNTTYRLLASIGLDAVGRESDSGSGVKRKIYLSRRGNDNRRFLSEMDIESALHSRGFEIVHPESLPVTEQIKLFANSAVIVGCSGAAFANVIYCRPRSV